MNDYEKMTRSKYKDKTVAENYKKAYTDKINRKNFRAKIISAREKKCVAHALKHCDPSPQSILDIPCGTGKMSTIIPQNISVVACDISLEMIALGRQEYLQLVSFQGFVQADATHMPFSVASFDCILNIRLFHRVPQKIKGEIIKEMVRLSKQYLILTFAVDNIYQRIRKSIRRLFIPYNPVMEPIKSKEIRTVLEQSGLEIIKVYSVLPLLSNERVVFIKKTKSVLK